MYLYGFTVLNPDVFRLTLLLESMCAAPHEHTHTCRLSDSVFRFAQKVNKAAHGYGAYFALSIMDKEYKNDLTLEEAKAIMVKCIVEMQTRFLMHMANWKCKVIDAKGYSCYATFDFMFCFIYSFTYIYGDVS